MPRLDFLGFLACPETHYLHHAEMLNQLLPALRELLHLSGCTKHWRRFPSASANLLLSRNHVGSLREPPEALFLGTCWEQACQCFHKDRDQLCQEDFPGFVSWQGPKCSQTCSLHEEEAAATVSVLVVRTCSFHFLLRPHFSGSCSSQREQSLSGLSRPGAGRWMSLFLQGRYSFRAWHKTLPERKADLCCCWISAIAEMLQEGARMLLGLQLATIILDNWQLETGQSSSSSSSFNFLVKSIQQTCIWSEFLRGLGQSNQYIQHYQFKKVIVSLRNKWVF